jgi:endogenous inhibitor of DNA gyrase (YacG/DUF329 family)
MSRRYPLDALLSAMGMTLSAAQPILGLNGPDWRRYSDEGMTREVADRKAVKAGLHPYEVWPEMADHDLEDVSRPCADCGKSFIVNRDWQRFCSTECRQRLHKRNWARNKYRTDPEYRRRRIEQAARYEAEVRSLRDARQERQAS